MYTMENEIRPVTWHQAMEGRPILAKLREGGPLHPGKIHTLGRKFCVLNIGGKLVKRRYGEFFYGRPA